MRLFYFLVFYIILGSFAISQNIIHVSVNGSDSDGDGSIDNPYATMTEASNVALPGDTVYVHGGIYHNGNYGNGDIWKKTNVATIKCNGTPDAWITFKPFPGDSVLLETDANGVTIKGTYIVFTGFEMKAMADQITMDEAVSAWGLYKDSLGVVHDLAEELGIDYYDPNLWGQHISKPVLPNIQKPNYYNASFLVAQKTHHVIIENNIIRDVCASGLRNQGGDYITIKHNIIKGCSYWTSVGVGALTVAEATVRPEGDSYSGVKIIIESNYVYNNANKLVSWNPYKDFIHWVIDEGSGIFLTRNNDTYDHGYMLIANNLSYLNGASGIMVHKTDRVIVEQNTCYHNGVTNGDSKAGGIGMNSTIDVVIRNNISWASPDKSALYKQGGELIDLVIEGNLFYNENGSQDLISGVPDEGYFEANPLLVNPQNSDFRLTAESPAINNGVPNIYVTEDITGFPRNDGNPDIGAYEYNPTSGTPKISTNNNFVIFPNPVDDYLIVKTKNTSTEIKVFDLSGKEVRINIKKTGENFIKLNTKDLISGVYIIKINNTAKTFIKR